MPRVAIGVGLGVGIRPSSLCGDSRDADVEIADVWHHRGKEYEWGMFN